MGLLDGKVAVITGAGSGMAKASVKLFVAEGAHVVAADISGAEKDTASEVGGGVLPVHCDVTKEPDVEAIMRAAVEEFGRLDAVLNVAGIADGMMLTDVTMEQYDRMMDIDLRGVFLGLKHGIRTMLECGNGGTLVNWSSIGGLNSSPYTSVYGAAKAGVVSLTKTAALEYGAKDVRVNCVCPGFIKTEIMGDVTRPLSERGRAHADAATRSAPRGRRGSGVPVLGPHVVRHRCDRAGRRRSHRCHRVTTAPSAARYVGARVHRVEDARLLTGHSCYVDDLDPPGTLHARFVRSTFARAAIRGIDTSAALALPGVRHVFTAADLNPDVREQWHSSVGPDGPETPRPPLAENEARFVGDPVALVVADTLAIAHDAAELVDVDYEPLDPVVDYMTAESNPELVHEQHGTNVIGELAGLPLTAMQGALDDAAHVVSETIYQHAHVPAPMEGRAMLVDYSSATGELTIHAATQVPHEVRLFCSRLLGVPEHRIRVIRATPVAASARR